MQLFFKNLFQEIKGDIYEKEMEIYELKMGKIKAHLLEQFINKDPKKKNLSNDEFLDKYISKGKSPSKTEIEKF